MSTFRTSRKIAASPDAVFAAMTTPARLARWWGPAGFTNEFDLCDLRPGGAWRFVMHGPGGKHFRNESVFEEIVPKQKFVIRHVSEPTYRLTITLTPTDGETNVGWEQIFDNAEIAKRIEHIVTPANVQNLDRLTAETLGSSD